MIRKSVSLTARVLVVGVLVSGSAVAGGGRGGDGSMNPFTGDSYAYFHGGHNLGEEGMILPGRAPPAKVTPSVRNKSRSTTSAGPTGAFQSSDARRDGQVADTQRGTP